MENSMRQAIIVPGLCAILLLGCANASVTPPAAAIEDVEPEVTRQVAEVLERMSNGDVPRERFTERASESLEAAAIAAKLRPCPRPIAPALLERTTKGEDRQYLYRIPCGQQDLLAAIDFNKAARINSLIVQP
jgi:hypothetical protein